MLIQLQLTALRRGNRIRARLRRTRRGVKTSYKPQVCLEQPMQAFWRTGQYETSLRPESVGEGEAFLCAAKKAKLLQVELQYEDSACES